MRIQSSEAEFSQTHYRRYSETNITLSLDRSIPNRDLAHQNTDLPNQQPMPFSPTPPLNTSAFNVSISSYALEQLELSQKTIANSEQALDTTTTIDIKMALLKALVESLSGKKLDLGDFSTDNNRAATDTTAHPPSNPLPQAGDNRISYSGTFIRDYEISHTEIKASINDDQGRQIDISLSVTMERRYELSVEQLTIDSQRQLKDPLVINFNGSSVQLNNQRVEFDIDADGFSDLIPTLSSNSAYIALDKNQDGIINDGSELFGAITGNGFSELAQYDEDQNGYIDEGDSIFSALLSYTPSTGIGSSLEAMGVGALSLQSIASPFRITDESNNTLGQVRATGFYLNEGGSAGSLQQIDLSV